MSRSDSDSVVAATPQSLIPSEHYWRRMLCLHSGEGMCQRLRELKGMMRNNSFSSYGIEGIDQSGKLLVNGNLVAQPGWR